MPKIRIIPDHEEPFRPTGCLPLSCGCHVPAVRSPGVHLYDVLWGMRSDPADVNGESRSGGLIPLLFPKDFAAYSDDTRRAFQGFGLGYEYAELDSLSAQGRSVNRAGEITHHGIISTTDGLDVTEKLLIREFKATWASLANRESEILSGQSIYILQTAWYCDAWGTTTARISVMFVMGTYRGSGPIRRVYEIEFSTEDLRANSSMIVKHARSKGLV